MSAIKAALARIMRTPGTFNYKLGKDNAPLCHIVEVNDVRFSPAQIDEKLKATIQIQAPKEQATGTPTKSEQTFNEDFSDDRDFNLFRVRRMLDFISPSSLTYEDWLAVDMVLKNIGCNGGDWEQWSRSACRRGIIEDNLIWKDILATYDRGDDIKDDFADIRTKYLKIFHDLKYRVDTMSVENR